MSNYLKPTSKQAFKDIPLRDPAPAAALGWTLLCPVCQGHGEYNLRIDAYGPGNHFQCGCGQCDGWGYVDPNSNNATCLHEWKEVSYQECLKRGRRHYGMCWHVDECVKCGDVRSYDSSD